MVHYHTIQSCRTRPTEAQEGPLVTRELTVNITNTTFREEFSIPEKTFIPKDGVLSNLQLYLYNKDGSELPRDSWISLKGKTISLYSSRSVFQKQPSLGYVLRLSAIDQDARENHTSLTINFFGPFSQPNYVRNLVRFY